MCCVHVSPPAAFIAVGPEVSTACHCTHCLIVVLSSLLLERRYSFTVEFFLNIPFKSENILKPGLQCKAPIVFLLHLFKLECST